MRPLNPPSIGSALAEMRASYFVIGEENEIPIEHSEITFGEGTDANAHASTPPGSALEFYDTLGLYSAARITITGLNLTDISGTAISFALHVKDLFAAWEHMVVEYRTTGGWQTGENFGTLSRNTWDIYQVPLHMLDGYGDAGIRITVFGVMEAAKELRVDNIQIVPEPHIALLLALFAALFIWKILPLRTTSGTHHTSTGMACSD